MLSLRLSRACLGEKIAFSPIYKWLSKDRLVFRRPCVHALLHSIVKISGAAERGAAGTALALRLPPVMVGLFSGRVHAVVAAVGQRGRVLYKETPLSF